MRLLPRKFPNLSRNLPLHLILVVPFVLQTVLVAGVIGYFSSNYEREAVRGVSTRLRDELSARIAQNLQSYLETPQTINQINATAIRLGQLNIQDPASLERHFWHQLGMFKGATAIAFANPRQEVVTAERMMDGSLTIRVSGPATGYELRTYTTNRRGDRLKLINVGKNYNPHRRSWYQIPVQTGQASWSRIYPHVTGETLYLGAGQPVYSSQGKLRGVLLANLNLLQISSFLQNLNVGKTGQTFILDRSGALIATSTTETPFRIKTGPVKIPEDKVVLLKATESRNRITQATAKYLEAQLGGVDTIHPKQQLDFKIDGQQQFLQVIPFTDRRGIDWRIVVVIPEAAFTDRLHLNAQTTLLLSLSAFGLITALSILIARQLTQPIHRLVDAAEAIASGDLNQTVSVGSIRELQILARAFNQMVRQLRASFARVAQTNEDLEDRVEQRTAELSQNNQQLEQEIEERQKAEAALQDSEAELRLLFDAMIDTVIVFDAEGRFLKYIQTQSLIYKPGVDRIGKTVHEILPRQAADLFLDAIRRALYLQEQSHIFQNCYDSPPLSQRSICVEYSLPIQGKKIWFSAYVSPLSENTVLWVARDISDRKRTEQELEQAKQEAEAANHVKNKFLARMSHELRTPLNVILGFTQLMSDNSTPNPKQQEYLNIINRSGEHLLTLINDVLDMSKIEMGSMTLNESDFDLRSLLDWLQQTFQLKAKSKGLQLTFDLCSDLPSAICSDEGKLRQVLMNLLGNAIKFTQSGNVVLRVKSEPDVEREPEGIYLSFAVEDTGPGIASTELATLFAPFVQAEAGRNAQEGAGLGLSISQECVRLMGGTIAVDSRLGEGTTFSFSIQTTCAASNEASDQESSRQIIGLETSQPNYRILVVDDNAECRQLFIELLTPVGFEVREAEDGQAAIALWQEWSPDLIWLDMQMPVLDGLEAMQQIKSAQHQAPVIIALTGSISEAEETRAFSSGCDDFMRKPVQASLIFDKMAEHLGVRYRYQVSSLHIQNNQTRSGKASSDLPQLDQLKIALSEMSIDWIEAFHQAATRLNARQINDLIAQIPPAHPQLANGLTYLVNNFCFEEMIEISTLDHP
jgi:signal transduction histidine kinase/DNA-binding response OmpR family regulator